MNVAIIGSRSFSDYEKLSKTVTDLYSISDITAIVSGGAAGADFLGERFANDNNIDKIIFKADWKKYGKAAGMIRNSQIIENSDVVFAFWDGVSNGTKDSINKAKKANKILYVVI